MEQKINRKTGEPENIKPQNQEAPEDTILPNSQPKCTILYFPVLLFCGLFSVLIKFG
ncbi:MAG: hypothetical protein Q7T20_16115 [Saprospiraceae bacterium]|nr:hypothetical protein [Saprospiraceae bacterium]